MNVRQNLQIIVAALVISMGMFFALWGFTERVSAQDPDPTPIPASDTDGGVVPNPPNAPVPDNGPDAPNRPDTGFSYYQTAGTAFQPRTSTTAFSYSSTGCMYQNGGNPDFFQQPLVLPEGSVIKYIRIFYQDTASQDMTGYLTRYDPGQATNDLVSVNSTGAGGFGTMLSSEITETVDTFTYAYALHWRAGVTSSANQICGMRVAYYGPTLFGTFLPFLKKE